MMSGSRKSGLGHASVRWGVSLFLVVIVAVSSGCGTTTENGDPTRAAASSNTPNLGVLSVDSVHSAGSRATRTWHSDPVLVDIDLEIRPLSQASRLGASLIYTSEGHSEEFLIVWLRSTTPGDLAVEDLRDGVFEDPRAYRDNAVDIKLEDIKMDSEVALTRALELGGKEFIAEHQQLSWPASLKLEREDSFTETGPLRWIATFESSSLIMHFFIDDSTGALIETRVFDQIP